MDTQLIASLIVLAFLGLIDSAYLYWHHLRKKPLACPIDNHDCNAVVESKWGKLFGFKNEVLGIFYYVFVIVLAFLLFYGTEKLIYFLTIISLGALAFSFYLFYVQAKILRNYCFYCLISALINLLIFGNVIALMA